MKLNLKRYLSCFVVAVVTLGLDQLTRPVDFPTAVGYAVLYMACSVGFAFGLGFIVVGVLVGYRAVLDGGQKMLAELKVGEAEAK